MNEESEITGEAIWKQCLELTEKGGEIPASFITSTLNTASAEVLGSQLVVKFANNVEKILKDYREILNEILAKVCAKLGIEALDLQVFESDQPQRLPMEGTEPKRGEEKGQGQVPRQGRIHSNRALKQKYTFGDFVPGTSTRLPRQACMAVAEEPGKNYNPLFLYGNVGLGKTHLLQAIGHYVNDHFKKYKCSYATTNEFVGDFVSSLGVGGEDKNRLTEQFNEKYRDIDVLLLDDIQFLKEKEATKNALFVIVDELFMSGKQIVLAADKPPKELEDIPARLTTRFEAGLVLDIKPPDFETRIAILQHKIKNHKIDQKNIEIAEEAIEYIAQNFTDNIREMEGALNRVIAYSMLNNLEHENGKTENIYINLFNVQEVLKELIGDSADKPLTATEVLKMCAEYLHCSTNDLIGPTRTKQITTARHISMYVMREVTELSYPQIGDLFGGRDHSTVMYAIRDKVIPKMGNDPELFNQVSELLRLVKTRDRKLLEDANKSGRSQKGEAA